MYVSVGRVCPKRSTVPYRLARSTRTLQSAAARRLLPPFNIRVIITFDDSTIYCKAQREGNVAGVTNTRMYEHTVLGESKGVPSFHFAV